MIKETTLFILFISFFVSCSSNKMECPPCPESGEKALTDGIFGGSINADNMNVLYAGVNNPISVSIYGADSPSSLRVNKGTIVSKGMNRFNFFINENAIRHIVTFTASSKTKLGKTISVSRKFRVKSPPRPSGSITGRKDYITLSKNLIPQIKVDCDFRDFEFPITAKVLSFRIKVSGYESFDIKGDMIGDVLEGKYDTGDILVIHDIKTETNSGLILTATPIIIEVN